MGPSPGLGAYCVHLCAATSQPQSTRMQTCQKHLLFENTSSAPSSVTPACCCRTRLCSRPAGVISRFYTLRDCPADISDSCGALGPDPWYVGAHRGREPTPIEHSISLVLYFVIVASISTDMKALPKPWGLIYLSGSGRSQRLPCCAPHPHLRQRHRNAHAMPLSHPLAPPPAAGKVTGQPLLF